MHIHIWHEDAPNSSTTKLFKLIVGNSKYFSVEGTAYKTTGFAGGIKKQITYFGHRGLVTKIREKLTQQSATDLYIIFLDYVPTTPSIKSSIDQIEKHIATYGLNNVYLAKAISFEYILLTMKSLIKWTKPNRDNDDYDVASEIRKKLIEYMSDPTMSVSDIGIISNNSIKNWGSNCKVYLDVSALVANKGFASLEEVSTRLLQELCNWHIGFRYDKTGSKLGSCWYTDCCFKFKCRGCNLHSNKDLQQYKECRKCSGICQKCDLSSCGTQSVNMSADDKANEILKNSILYEILQSAHKYFLKTYGNEYLCSSQK